MDNNIQMMYLHVHVYECEHVPRFSVASNVTYT